MHNSAPVRGRCAAHRPASSPGQRQPGVVTLPPCRFPSHGAIACAQRHYTVQLQSRTLASDSPGATQNPAATRLAACLVPGSLPLLGRHQLLALLSQVVKEQQQIPPELSEQVRARLSSMCLPPTPTEAFTTLSLTKQLGIHLSPLHTAHHQHGDSRDTRTVWTGHTPLLLRRVVACLDSPAGPCTIHPQEWSLFLAALAWHVTDNDAHLDNREAAKTQATNSQAIEKQIAAGTWRDTKPSEAAGHTASYKQASAASGGMAPSQVGHAQDVRHQQQGSGICSLAGRRAWIRAVLETAPAQALSKLSQVADNHAAVAVHGQCGSQQSTGHVYNYPVSYASARSWRSGMTGRNHASHSHKQQAADSQAVLMEAVQQLHQGVHALQQLQWPELSQCINMGVISLAPAAQLLNMALAPEPAPAHSGSSPVSSASITGSPGAAATARMQTTVGSRTRNSSSSASATEAHQAEDPHPALPATPHHCQCVKPKYPHTSKQAVQALAVLCCWAANAARSSKQPGSLVCSMLRDALQQAVLMYTGWVPASGTSTLQVSTSRTPASDSHSPAADMSGFKAPLPDASHALATDSSAASTSLPDASASYSSPLGWNGLEVGTALLRCALCDAPALSVPLTDEYSKQLLEAVATQLSDASLSWDPSALHNFVCAMSQLPDAGLHFLTSHPAVLTQIKRQASMLAPMLDAETSDQLVALQHVLAQPSHHTRHRAHTGVTHHTGHTHQSDVHRNQNDGDKYQSGLHSQWSDTGLHRMPAGVQSLAADKYSTQLATTGFTADSQLVAQPAARPFQQMDENTAGGGAGKGGAAGNGEGDGSGHAAGNAAYRRDGSSRTADVGRSPSSSPATNTRDSRYPDILWSSQPAPGLDEMASTVKQRPPLLSQQEASNERMCGPQQMVPHEPMLLVHQLARHVQQLPNGLALLDALAVHAVTHYGPLIKHLFQSSNGGDDEAWSTTQLAQLAALPCVLAAPDGFATPAGTAAVRDDNGKAGKGDKSIRGSQQGTDHSSNDNTKTQSEPDGLPMTDSSPDADDIIQSSSSGSSSSSEGQSDELPMTDSSHAALGSIQCSSSSSSDSQSDGQPTADSIASAILATVLQVDQEQDAAAKALLRWKATCTAWLFPMLPASQLTPSLTLVIVWSAATLKLDMGDAWMSHTLQLVQSALAQQANTAGSTTMDTQLLVWAVAQLQQVGSASLLLQTCGATSRQHELLQQLLSAHGCYASSTTTTANLGRGQAAAGSGARSEQAAAGKPGNNVTAGSWLSQASMTDIAAALQCLLGVGAQPSLGWLVQVSDVLDTRLAELSATQVSMQHIGKDMPYGPLQQLSAKQVQRAASRSTAGVGTLQAKLYPDTLPVIADGGDAVANTIGSGVDSDGDGDLTSNICFSSVEASTRHLTASSSGSSASPSQQPQQQAALELQASSQQPQQHIALELQASSQQPTQQSALELQAGKQAVNSLVQLAGAADA